MQWVTAAVYSEEIRGAALSAGRQRCSEEAVRAVEKVYRRLTARDPWGSTFASQDEVARRSKLKKRTVTSARAELKARGRIVSARWRRHISTGGADVTWTFWLGPGGFEHIHPALRLLFTDRDALHEQFPGARIRIPSRPGQRKGLAHVPLTWLLPVGPVTAITERKSAAQLADQVAREICPGDPVRAKLAPRNRPYGDVRSDIDSDETLTASRAALGGAPPSQVERVSGPRTGGVSSLAPRSANGHPAAAKRRGSGVRVSRVASRRCLGRTGFGCLTARSCAFEGESQR